MRRRRFYFLEPSKVGSQHITFIEAYLSALTSSELLRESFDLVFCASASTAAELSRSVVGKLDVRRIHVMNPEKRRLALKTCVEWFVVTGFLWKLRRGDILFVSCVLPTTLLLLELTNKVLRRRGLFVTLHGEIEGAFDKALQRPRSFGFWVLQWIGLRRPGSFLRVTVIDDFIKSRLIDVFPDRFLDADIVTVHNQLLPFQLVDLSRPNMGVCFIGYRTVIKGFQHFADLSTRFPDIEFLAIGGGKTENVRNGQSKPLLDGASYLREIAGCAVAFFPYISGYSCSLSAAAIDALSVGVHIVAFDRPCFVHLRESLGDDAVTICATTDEAATLIGNLAWREAKFLGRQRRLERLAASKYGSKSVVADFERLISKHDEINR